MLRHNENDDPNTLLRSDGFLATDCRQIILRNNTFKNCDILFCGNLSHLSGHSTVENNSIDNGSVDIREINNNVVVRNNTIANSPEQAIRFYCTVPRHYPFQGHVIQDNTITGIDGKMAFNMQGDMRHISIVNNSFTGCRQDVITLDLNETSEDIVIEGNSFNGLSARAPITSVGDVPDGISFDLFNSSNTFSSDCSVSAVEENATSGNGIQIWPNPVKNELRIEGITPGTLYAIYDINGRRIQSGQMDNQPIKTQNLKAGLYFLQLNGVMCKFTKS